MLISLIGLKDKDMLESKQKSSRKSLTTLVSCSGDSKDSYINISELKLQTLNNNANYFFSICETNVHINSIPKHFIVMEAEFDDV